MHELAAETLHELAALLRQSGPCLDPTERRQLLCSFSAASLQLWTFLTYNLTFR